VNIPVVYLYRQENITSYRPLTTYKSEHSLRSFDDHNAYRWAVNLNIERIHSYVVQTIRVEVEIISDFYTIEQTFIENVISSTSESVWYSSDTIRGQ
jgi:hypothetical protein